MTDALAALDRAGVRWCLLREPGSATDDLDLLVEPGAGRAIAAALRGVGFAELARWQPGGHRAFLRLRANGGWEKLDLVSRLSFGPWGERPLPVEADVLRRRGNDPARPDAEDELWLLVLHHLLDRDGPAPAARRQRLEELAVQSGSALAGPVARAAVARCGEQHLTEALSALCRGDHAAHAAIAARVRAEWRSRPLGMVRARVRRKWDRLPVHSSRRGLTCAVLGPDGAGKSTLTTALVETLPVPTRRVYMGYPTTRSRWPGPGRTFVPKAVTLFRGALSAQRQRRAGGIAVLDRFGDDFAVVEGGWKRRLAGRTLGGLASPARPDVVVILDAPAEVMFARKGEHDVAELDRRRRRYLRLLDEIPGAVRIDATRDPGSVLSDATAAIWAAFERRVS
jgi:thymidylate kinase